MTPPITSESTADKKFLIGPTTTSTNGDKDHVYNLGKELFLRCNIKIDNKFSNVSYKKTVLFSFFV